MKTTTLQKTQRYSFFMAKSAVVIIILILLVGCSAHYGRLEKSSEIIRAFESYQILKDYRYYYSGRQNKPSAIIGVHRDYSFSSKYWTEIELTPEAFKKAVDRLYLLYGSPPYGAYIIDPNGKRAGIWFSSINFATIKLKDGNRLIILTPEPLDEPEGPGKDFKKISKLH